MKSEAYLIDVACWSLLRILEGMPNVIMEGMAGLAVLTTDVGAISSVVNQENGWFVTPGDAEGLKNQIQEIIELTDDQLRTKQESSLKRIREFTSEKIGELTAARIAKARLNSYLRGPVSVSNLHFKNLFSRAECLEVFRCFCGIGDTRRVYQKKYYSMATSTGSRPIIGFRVMRGNRFSGMDHRSQYIGSVRL